MNSWDHDDSSNSSDKTIIVDSQETCNKNPKDKDFYNLDFSDEEFDFRPLSERCKASTSTSIINNINNNENAQQNNANSSWQDQFSAEDFCENSNEFEAVLSKISQLESEENYNKSVISSEMECLFDKDILEEPRRKIEKQEEEVEFDLHDELERIKETVRNNLKNEDIGVSSDEEDPVPRKVRKKTFPKDKEAERLEKELNKQAKAKERNQKRIEKENQKQLKNALKVVENCVKPDHCTKYLTVNIDQQISEKHYGEAIKASLNNACYNYKTIKQNIPGTISWTREVPTLENMLLQNVNQQEKHFLLIMELSEFLEKISQNVLAGYFQSLLSMTDVEHLSVAILGLQKYYQFLRNVNNRDFKNAVAQIEDSSKKPPNAFRDLPKVSKDIIEKKIVQLQIFCKNVYIRPVDKFEDLALFVTECCKSVAQLPYKLAKSQSFLQENEFFSVNNRDCIKVDKDGHGLGRLWNQCLKMFPLASLETAEAVSSVYPTMHSLIEAYRNCSSQEQGEKLLQDILVRRAAGPLAAQRKLGPEFSKKCFRFFTSYENVLL